MTAILATAAGFRCNETVRSGSPHLARAAALAAALLSGCGSTSVRIETVAAPTSKPVKLESVVLLPIVNRSEDKLAGPAVEAVLARALATQAKLRVVGLPAGILVDAERLDRDQARDVAKAAGADAVVTAVLFAYGYVPDPRSAEKPAVRLDVRVMSGSDPALLWAARASAFDSPGMGSGGATLTSIADETARKLIQDFARSR